MSQVSAVFTKAAALVEQGWCQHNFAQDSAGLACSPTSTKAIKWCLWGACNRAASDLTTDRVQCDELAHKVRKALLQDGLTFLAIFEWNDHYYRDAGEVVRRLQRLAEVTRDDQ